MSDCIHGLEEGLCGSCSYQRERSTPGREPTRDWDGQTFTLIYAPSIRDDTFLHLNRQGSHWKIRWYKSPNEKPFEVAQSGLASTRQVYDLNEVEFVHEVTYPYSTSIGGESVKNAQYWFDEIARVNDKHGVSAGSPQPG